MAQLKAGKHSTRMSFSEDETATLKVYRDLRYTPRWIYKVDGRTFINYGWVPQCLPEHDPLTVVFKLDGYWKQTGEIVCTCGECFSSPIIDEMYGRPKR